MVRRATGIVLLLLVAPLAAAQGPAPASSDCAVTDLMPAFWSFWEKAEDKEATEQYRLFEKMVRKPNAAVYAGVFQGVSKPLPELIPSSVKTARPFEAAMRGLSRKLKDELPVFLTGFREAFSDFRCTTPVYFVYSAGAFDGATRDVSGKEALMFGLDVIARLGEELSPLVIHELFHVYHGERVTEPSKAFYWSMWEEGLATYVSRRLNPDVPEQKVCCLPPIGPVEATLPKIAAEALTLLDSEKRDDYARFFYGSQKIDFRARSGYYLGYRAASEAGKTHSLRELAGLSPDQVRPLIEAELKRLSTSQKTTASAFRSLMETVAAGWNEGDARKAADCFTEDALYLEPPDRQFYSGRPALYEFFGGGKKPEPPMRMTWHHLAFDEESQVGFGEYTFQMNRRYHGVVVVKVRDGRITNWREYQYESKLDWNEFVRKNAF